MMRLNIPGLAALLVLVAAAGACSNRAENRTDEARAASEMEPAYDKAKSTGSPDVTKMQREAELRFRVKDVHLTTIALERMAASFGGYVAVSNYEVEEEDAVVSKISRDSAREVRKLLQRNHMEVFVLNAGLDSFLSRLAPMADHLAYRRITAHHAGIEAGRGALSDHPENAKPGIMQIRYARVVMDFDQPAIVKKWVIPNPDSLDAAKGGIAEDLVNALKSGWAGLMAFVSGLLAFWPLWLLLSMAWLVIRRRWGKKPLWLPFAAKKAAT